MLLEGKACIVTGGARGLGRSFALALAREGAKVLVADIDEEGAKRVADELLSLGSEGLGVKVDVSKEEDTKRMAHLCHSAFGAIDVLVNNAAIYYGLRYTPFDQISEEEWDRLMAVNVKGVWLCTKAVVPYMKERGGGKIINMASGAPLKGNPGLLHYNASKAAVIGLTRSLARELGPFGIRVNAIAPGITLTEATRRLADEERLAKAIEARCLKRHEEPEDLVGALLFLASPMSDFVTGQTIAVNGGDLFL